MPQHRKALTDLLRPRLAPPGFNAPGFLPALDRWFDAAGVPADVETGPGLMGSAQPSPPVADGPLTARVVLEALTHESLVLEAYKDSKGIWTWAGGLTAASGVDPLRYKDNPSTLGEALRATIGKMRNAYLPEVQRAFGGRTLTEAQLAAALSFHWNTGAIERASWVDLWLAGNVSAAYDAFLEWKRPASIIERRKKEADLFFDGKWSQDGKVTIWGVRKPSYSPDWGSGRRVDVSAEVAKLLGNAP
jgi:lysozyme